MKPAFNTQDSIARQMYLLMEEYKKDYSRVNVLQQFIALGMAHKRYDVVEQNLHALLKWGEQQDHLYFLIATMQERQEKYLQAADNIRNLFRCEGIKTETMYNAAGRILPRTESTGDLELCCQLLEEGVKQCPQSAGITHNLGEAYRMMGRYKDVLPLYKDAIARMPGDETHFFGLGLMEMVTSNLTTGFDAYKHRFHLPKFKEETPSLPWPEWQGEPLKGKKIYLWAEQGVGDILMWAGMLPWILQQGANVTCAVSARMIPLFGRSFPHIQIVEKALVLPKKTLQAGFDYHSPMGNLMEYVLPHYKPAEHPPYLIADKEAVARKRKEYLAHNPKAKKLVGVSWYTRTETGWRRNIPLNLFQPLLNDPEAVYVALQYNQRLDDVDLYNRQNVQPVMTDYSFIPVDDIDAWATQHAAMDEVFSIQNSSVHLAGALGVPTTVFLPSYGSWHWGNGDTHNAWYDSVTVCRQKPVQKWKFVIKEFIRGKPNDR